MNAKTNPPLILARPLANQILAHAQQNPETEICGLVSSKNNLTKHYYPIPNVADNTATHFKMDEHAQIATMKKIREKNEELFAIVHSHPHEEATPSMLDQTQHQYTDTYYLIVSLNTVGVLELRAFKQISQRFEPVELILEHPAS